MICRKDCGACCIYASVNSSKIPGMPNGKPSGIKCIHLNDKYKCNLWNLPSRPDFCNNFKAEIEICGITREDAINNIIELEAKTK